jgi:hypothetical protein
MQEHSDKSHERFSSEQLADAFQEGGRSYRGAARVLGVAYGSKFRKRVNAALLGPAEPPAGFTPIKVTTNGHGDPTAVQSVPIADPDLTKPVLPPDHYVKGISSYLSHGTVTGQWVKTDKVKQAADASRWAAVSGLLETLPALPAIPRAGAADDQLLNVIVFGDPHFGMLAHERETGEPSWDMKIAREVMHRALEKLIYRLPEAGQFLLINVGDYFHFEDDNQSTPRGHHKQDGDGRFTKMAEAGAFLLADLTQLCLNSHPSGALINVPGNHDVTGARWLNLWARAFFRNQANLTIEDNADPVGYFSFGENLIGTYHGDGGATKKLPGVMAAHQGGKLWGMHRHRRWITGHHHVHAIEPYAGVFVEKFPTLAPLDMWSHWKLFDGAERSLNAITLHHREGEIGRSKVLASEIWLPGA